MHFHSWSYSFKTRSFAISESIPDSFNLMNLLKYLIHSSGDAFPFLVLFFPVFGCIPDVSLKESLFTSSLTQLLSVKWFMLVKSSFFSNDLYLHETFSMKDLKSCSDLMPSISRIEKDLIMTDCSSLFISFSMSDFVSSSSKNPQLSQTHFRISTTRPLLSISEQDCTVEISKRA